MCIQRQLAINTCAIGMDQHTAITCLITTAILITNLSQAEAATCARLTDNGQTQNEDYDPKTEICCNGNIFQKRADKDFKCCGGTLYTQGTHKCCGSQLFGINDPTQCCNNIPYNENAHMCCKNNIIAKEEGIGCCGGSRIDLNTQTCCYNINDNRYSPVQGLGKCCGPDKVYNPHTDLCCKTHAATESSVVHTVGREAIITGDMQCCGTAEYNTTEQHCCVDSFSEQPYHSVTRGDFTRCCGKDVYDERTETCCSKTKHLLTHGRTECCGSNPYNSANEQCSGNQVKPIGHGKTCSNRPYDPMVASCCKGTYLNTSIPEVSDIQDCCDTTSYLKTDQVCCDNTLHKWQPDMLCCGQAMYNTSTHLCCGKQNTIVLKHHGSETSECCGHAAYDPTSQTCCPLSKQVFDNVANGACCPLNITHEEAYDPETHTCCKRPEEGVVYLGAEKDQQDQCCGSHLLISTELCDWTRANPISKTMTQDNHVCWRRDPWTGHPVGNEVKTYNTNSQACTMDGNIIGKLPEEEFCGNSLYDTRTHICCGWRKYDKVDVYGKPRQCCTGGGEGYVPAQQSCYAGTVFNIPEAQSGFCHGIGFDTTTHECDINGLVRLSEEVQQYPSLCSSRSTGPSSWIPYHPSEHACCNGELIGAGQTCCNGHVKETPGLALGDGKCCGGNAYNPETHKCCGDALTEKNGREMECCARRAYDITGNQKCCDGSLQSSAGGRTECTMGTLHRPDETVCGEVGYTVRYGVPNGVCCGRQLVNATDICCQELIYSRTLDGDTCCGSVAYRSSDTDKLCCAGSLHQDAIGLECCGTTAINDQTLCCGNQTKFAYSINNQAANPVCCDATNYDVTKHTCCNGLLHLHTANGKCCGPSLVRDDTKEICCGGKVEKKKHGNNSKCCGQSIIDNRRYECCGGKFMSSGGWRKCCNREIVHWYEECEESQTQPASGSQGLTYHPDDPTESSSTSASSHLIKTGSSIQQIITSLLLGISLSVG